MKPLDYLEEYALMIDAFSEASGIPREEVADSMTEAEIKVADCLAGEVVIERLTDYFVSKARLTNRATIVRDAKKKFKELKQEALAS